jgi:membrane protein involved in colicin uptake
MRLSWRDSRGVTSEIQLGFKYPELKDRQATADAAKKAMLEKFRAASQDPAIEEQRVKRAAIHEARLVRGAEREAAKKAREAELAAQAAREAELAAQAAREAEEAKARAAAAEADRVAMLEAEQKAARDARYAARKADKKVRRRGY